MVHQPQNVMIVGEEAAGANIEQIALMVTDEFKRKVVQPKMGMTEKPACDGSGLKLESVRAADEEAVASNGQARTPKTAQRNMAAMIISL